MLLLWYSWSLLWPTTVGLYAEHGWIPGEAALPAGVRPWRPPPPRARHREARGGDHQGDKLHHRQRAAQQGRRVSGGKHHIIDIIVYHTYVAGFFKMIFIDFKFWSFSTSTSCTLMAISTWQPKQEWRSIYLRRRSRRWGVWGCHHPQHCCCCAGRGWGQAAGEEPRPVGGGLGVGRHGGGAGRGRGNVRWTRDTDDTMALSWLNIKILLRNCSINTSNVLSSRYVIINHLLHSDM